LYGNFMVFAGSGHTKTTWSPANRVPLSRYSKLYDKRRFLRGFSVRAGSDL